MPAAEAAGAMLDARTEKADAGMNSEINWEAADANCALWVLRLRFAEGQEDRGIY